MSRPFFIVAALALALAALTSQSVAQADPVVVVFVRGNAAGVTVIVTDVGGQARSCSTDDTGSCEIRGLAPGQATVVSRIGSATSGAQTVMIPPDGKVSLYVPSP